MNERNSALVVVFAISILATSACAASPPSATAPNYAPDKADAFMALNDPDRFAWALFSAINVPAENTNPRDVIWELWPEQGDIYANPKVAPKWPTSEFPGKNLRPSTQHHARNTAMQGSGILPPLPTPRDGVSNEEVRDNKDAFDYIVNNELWYKEGIVDKVRDDNIEFPFGAIAIKGKWKVITEEQKPRFHWHEYTDPKTRKPVAVGLVALHIASKILKTWHWSTFEQIDNPGLADYIGVHDSFGIRPTDIWPNRLTNQGYSDAYGKPKGNVGKLTDAVKQMMADSGLSTALSTYYRLKGAQVAFTDRTGRPTIVGNSITEAGFVSTSSCITCHARASVGAPSQGQNGFPVPESLSVFTDRGESFNGPVDPLWYWDPLANYSSPPAEPEAYHKSLEFLWQLAFGPKARNPKKQKPK